MYSQLFFNWLEYGGKNFHPLDTCRRFGTSKIKNFLFESANCSQIRPIG